MSVKGSVDDIRNASDYWPCACVRRDRRGRLTHVKLQPDSVAECRSCHATREDAMRIRQDLQLANQDKSAEIDAHCSEAAIRPILHVAEGAGFEPAVVSYGSEAPDSTPDFESGGFDRSPTPPLFCLFVLAFRLLLQFFSRRLQATLVVLIDALESLVELFSRRGRILQHPALRELGVFAPPERARPQEIAGAIRRPSNDLVDFPLLDESLKYAVNRGQRIRRADVEAEREHAVPDGGGVDGFSGGGEHPTTRVGERVWHVGLNSFLWLGVNHLPERLDGLPRLREPAFKSFPLLFKKQEFFLRSF